MPLDAWSVILASVLSVFSFLVFMLVNKRSELNMIEKQVVPASKEALEVLIKNFLSFGEIPTKSKLISIMTSLARKHHVQLLAHLPIQNVIDNLIYYVISNDLLDPYKKKEISDRLIKLKTEPMTSEDYLQMLADNEEANSWKQKLIYTQLAAVLIYSSLLIIALGVCSSQLKVNLTPQIIFLMNWFLVATIGFSVLVAAYTISVVYSHYLQAESKQTPNDRKFQLPAGVQQLETLINPQAAQQNRKQALPTQKNSLSVQSRHSQTGNKLQSAEKMMSIDSVTNLESATKAEAINSSAEADNKAAN
ncbi:MAG: hypothetical protein SFU25_04365 [Candidatus Caenarcaniphilales bacterium]|nr:hypothetical protein [Candidatus Caenarcaniphilales bacterium]